jgi:hypothetical protein
MRFEAKSVEKVNEMIDVFYEVLKVRDEFDVEPILGLKM